jgi:hypothetical protein
MSFAHGDARMHHKNGYLSRMTPWTLSGYPNMRLLRHIERPKSHIKQKHEKSQPLNAAREIKYGFSSQHVANKEHVSSQVLIALTWKPEYNVTYGPFL